MSYICYGAPLVMRRRSKGGFWRAAEMALDRVTEMAHVTTLKAHSYGRVGSFRSSFCL